jgi:hypothetical protein
MPAPQHARTQIADRIKEILTGLPTTGDNVFKGRTRPLPKNHPPLLLVYARSEQSAPEAMGILGRRLRLRIEGRVTMADVPDGTLDQIALEVEPAMVADFTLGGLVREVTLISTTVETAAPGDAQAGEIGMEYEIFYRTREDAPAVAIK